ncbi:MAG: YggT family protein [Chloroflexota bacterium]
MSILVTVINYIFAFFYILLFARIILSWVRPDPYNPTYGWAVRLIYDLTEPVLGPVRRLLPSMGGLDFSPLIVFLLARVLQQLLIGLLI